MTECVTYENEEPVVYVVDDDAGVRQALDSLIRSVGFSVQTFASAQEFLKRNQRARMSDARRAHARLKRTGSAARLAEADIHIPVIFITGHGDIPMSVRAMKAGAVEFLTKPFRDQDLLDAIEQAIQRDRNSGHERKEIEELRERSLTDPT